MQPEKKKTTYRAVLLQAKQFSRPISFARQCALMIFACCLLSINDQYKEWPQICTAFCRHSLVSACISRPTERRSVQAQAQTAKVVLAKGHVYKRVIHLKNMVKVFG